MQVTVVTTRHSHQENMHRIYDEVACEQSEPAIAMFSEPPLLQNCSRYCEKMRDIRNGRFFTHLTTVDMGCV